MIFFRICAIMLINHGRQHEQQLTEAVTRRCSAKKVFLKVH